MREAMTKPFLIISILISVTYIWPAVASELASEKEAKMHYDLGVELFQEGNSEGSLVEFQKAYDLNPSYKIKYNIGQVLAEMDRWDEAYQWFYEYLEEGDTEITADRRAEVEAELHKLDGRIGWVLVTGDSKGAEIAVDGTIRATTPMDKPILLIVGVHNLEFYSQGQSQMKRQVVVTAGNTTNVVFNNPKPSKESQTIIMKVPEVPTPSKKKRPLLISGIVSMGIGAISLGVGAVYGGQALGLEEDLKQNCDGGKCPPYYDSAKVDEYNNDRMLSDIFLGIGTAFVVTGGILTVVDIIRKGNSEQKDSPLRVSINPLLDGGVITAAGRF